MDAADIEGVIAAFAAGARRAREAGFDAVELHGGTGYLLAQCLSPRTNLRQDRYGGDLERRMRFPLEVFRARSGAR
jgi:2,4-dienoyl-CoA reductase (NADPH2)